MDFEVLGPVQVRGDGAPTSPGRGHRRTILAVLLAARGRAVSTDALMASLWPGSQPRTARKSLQSHVSRLRTELHGLAEGDVEVLLSTPDGYRVDLDDHGLDAAAFEELVAAARRRLDEPAPDRAAALLDDALGRWRGPAFGELASHPRVRAEARRLEELRRGARADRRDAWLALGRHDRVAAGARTAVEEEPTDERAHGQLLRALYAAGRQSAAIEAYEELRTRLRDELGVDPAPELRRLHRQLLRQDPDLSGPTPAPPRPAASVPPVAADLVGRDRELGAISELVGPGRLVTLTGPGGVGKTRLAEQVVARIADRFRDGTAVVTLATVRDAEAVGDALVTALGIQPTGGATVADTLVSALADRQLLLVLDNCEHVLAAVAPLVASLLRHCDEVALLATSRERLRITGERLWQVAPLAVPEEGARPEEVLATPSGALFDVRAREADPTFVLDAEVAPDVAELCRRLDGMPLALELAAARTRTLAPADLVARLDQRFSLLAGGPRHEAGRHRTLEAVVAWSYGLLSSREALLFDRLSTFAGPVDLAAVEHVCAGEGIGAGEVAGLLGELVDKSMVVVEHTDVGPRYRLLDTMREFGARRLEEEGDPRRWRRQHAAHHVALVEDLGPRVRGADEAAAVTMLTTAFDDVRAAHAWLVGEGDVDGALRIPGALGDYLFYRLRDEVTTWARRALAMDGAETHRAQPAALATAALGATSRTECTRARATATRALARDAAGPRARVAALAALGTAALYEGRLEELLQRAEQVEAVASRLDDDVHVAFAGVLRVLAHAYREDLDAALAALPALDRAAAASRNPTMRAFARYCRGEVLLDTDPDAAVAALEEAVELASQVDNALVAGVSMVSLASLRARRDEATAALRTYREVVMHWRRLGDHTHQLTTLRNLVVLLADVDPSERVAVLHGAATAGRTPSFGPEQERLDRAWSALRRTLGDEAARAAVARGRGLGPGAAGGLALQHLDELLAD